MVFASVRDAPTSQCQDRYSLACVQGLSIAYLQGSRGDDAFSRTINTDRRSGSNHRYTINWYSRPTIFSTRPPLNRPITLNMPPPSKLAVATSSLVRLVKEEASYHKEMEQQQARIKKLEAGSDEDNAEYILRQEVLQSMQS